MVGQVIFSDHTTLTLAGSDLEWSKIEGPISTIDGDGKIMLLEVGDDIRATVVGSYRNLRSSISFTVSDVPAVLALGVDGNTDRDGDGQSDEFELLAGYRADDAANFFSYHLKKDAEGVFIELSKVVPGTRYIIEASADTRIYRKVAIIDPQEIEADLLFRDPQPLDRSKYYRVRLEPIDIAK
ncbi:MAG: hypothetical protein ACI8T1_005368 [Verrucomicrobiales bacterium]|jgi:hypothetical protein